VLVAAAAETAAGAEAGGAPPGGGDPVPGEEIVEAIATRLARRLGGGAIGGAAGGLACVVVPDPDAPGRRRQMVAAVVEGTDRRRDDRDAGGDETAPRVALGPTVPWHHATASLRRAAAAFRLDVADGPLIVAEEHLATLLLTADRGLAADLAASRLAPLAQLPDGPRARLTETLRAWLDRPGQVQAVAADLGVHPQTVRYRLKQLRELFGTRLEDPEARFELSLALRVG
jgi:sugar diacid utilization regulator